MADIRQAAKWMDEGKKVRRPRWKFASIGTAHSATLQVDIFTEEYGKQHFVLYVADLLADDWEIAD